METHTLSISVIGVGLLFGGTAHAGVPFKIKALHYYGTGCNSKDISIDVKQSECTNQYYIDAHFNDGLTAETGPRQTSVSKSCAVTHKMNLAELTTHA